LYPRYLSKIIGKTVKKNINSGVATSLELILV